MDTKQRKNMLRKKIPLYILAIVILLTAGVGFLFRSEIKTVNSIEKVDDYGVYTMEYAGDYGFDEFLEVGASNDEELIAFVARKLLKGLPITITGPKLSCTTFNAVTPRGEFIFGRNFDMDYSPAVLIHTKPDNGYESISMVNLAFLGYNDVFNSFAALIPSAIVMLIFFIIRILFEFTPYENAFDFVYKVLQAPLMAVGDSLGAEIIYVLLSSVFWFFGINGPSVTNTVYSPMHMSLSVENVKAFQQGLSLPHIYTQQFVDMFETFGGGGSTLSLVILMVTVCKSQRIKQLGKLSLVPGIFGINEPIIFGLPIVLNPIMIIPFIGVPLMNTILSSIAFKTGFLPYTNGVNLPWTTPIGFSGFLVTGSIKASIFQLILLALGCLVYYPFIKTLDKNYLKDESSENTKDESEDISFDDISIDDL